MKRIVFASLWLVGILLGIMAVLLLVRNAKAQARIEAIRKAGDPVSVMELQPSGIGNANNAATHLKAIIDDANAFNQTILPIVTGNDFDWVEGLPASDLQLVKDTIARYPGLFDKLDQASQCSRYDWGWDYAVPPSKFSVFDGISAPRAIARLNDCRARYLAATGKPDQSASACLTQLRLCRAQDELPTMMGFLVNTACRQTAIEGLNALLQTTELSEQTHDAIDMELAKHDSRDPLVFAMKSERAFGIAMIDEQLGVAGIISGALDNYLDVMEQNIEISVAEHHEIAGYQPIAAVGLATLMVPACDAAFDAADRNMAMVRCLRIINRIKQLEKRRQVTANPSSIALELDLPAGATIDPFNGNEISIRLIDKGWIVYSVGKDNVDGTGAITDYADIGLGPIELMPE